MSAKIIESDSEGITIQVTIPKGEKMLDSEDLIEKAVQLAKKHALSNFNTHSSSVEVEKKERIKKKDR